MDIPDHDPDATVHPPDAADGRGPVFEIDAGPPAEPEPAVTCWRCDRAGVPVGGRCRWCHARVVAAPAARTPAADPPHPLKPVLIVYGLMLVVSVTWGWVLLAARKTMTEGEFVAGTAALEVVDTVLAVVALAVVGGRGPAVVLPPGARAFAWAAAGPVLLLLVCLGMLYTAALREVIGADDVPGWMSGLSATTLLLVCVQPALVEELFFRYVAFGTLARTTSARAAVWVTAVMFAMAHIYNPLGLPYLFLAGVVLGYARLYGGLALSVVMHFGHNLAVVAIEGGR